MAIFASLFLCRVIGQMLVARGRVRFLPPMDQWQSGVLPYPVLRFAQGLILAVQVATIVQSRRGRGVFVSARPGAGRVLRVVSFGYFGGMIIRYATSMWRYPDRRWFGKTIPIWLHCVLAGYLCAYARLLRRASGD